MRRNSYSSLEPWSLGQTTLNFKPASLLGKPWWSWTHYKTLWTSVFLISKVIITGLLKIRIKAMTNLVWCWNKNMPEIKKQTVIIIIFLFLRFQWGYLIDYRSISSKSATPPNMCSLRSSLKILIVY